MGLVSWTTSPHSVFTAVVYHYYIVLRLDLLDAYKIASCDKFAIDTPASYTLLRFHLLRVSKQRGQLQHQGGILDIMHGC